MEYYKFGNKWPVYYAVDVENGVVAMLELREDTSGLVVEVIANCFSREASTYDRIAVDVIQTYSKTTQKEWQQAKKQATEFLKNLENTQ